MQNINGRIQTTDCQKQNLNSQIQNKVGRIQNERQELDKCRLWCKIASAKREEKNGKRTLQGPDTPDKTVDERRKNRIIITLLPIHPSSKQTLPLA